MHGHRASLVIHDRDPVTGQITLHLAVHDPDLLGKEYEFAIRVDVGVPEPDGVDHEAKIYDRRITLDHGRFEYSIAVPGNTLPICEYSGNRIRIRYRAELRPIGIRGLVSAVELPIDLPELARDHADPDPEEIMEPKDERSYLKNILALSGPDQIQAVGLLAAAGVIILVNTIIGIHDQFTPDHLSWLYTDGGRRNSPLSKSALGSSALGAAVYFQLQRVLRRYMEFDMKRFRERFQRGMSYPLAKLVSGKSRVRLEDVEIRVVVGNIEKGVVREKDSKGRKRKSCFSTATRAVTVFRKRIPVVEARVPLRHYLKTDSVNFDRAFDRLFPPIALKNKDYGLDLSWEIQLLHPDLTDQELVGEGKQFDANSFGAYDQWHERSRDVA